MKNVEVMQSFPYTLTASKDTYLPGETITITLNGADPFKGILLYAAPASNKQARVGKFQIPPGFQNNAPSCSAFTLEAPESVLTHMQMDGEANYVGQQVFSYTAPPSNQGDLMFNIIIVQKCNDIFKTAVMSDVLVVKPCPTSPAPAVNNPSVPRTTLGGYNYPKTSAVPPVAPPAGGITTTTTITSTVQNEITKTVSLTKTWTVRATETQIRRCKRRNGTPTTSAAGPVRTTPPAGSAIFNNGNNAGTFDYNNLPPFPGLKCIDEYVAPELFPAAVPILSPCPGVTTPPLPGTPINVATYTQVPPINAGAASTYPTAMDPNQVDPVNGYPGMVPPAASTQAAAAPIVPAASATVPGSSLNAGSPNAAPAAAAAVTASGKPKANAGMLPPPGYYKK
jgi:hypothetical protein